MDFITPWMMRECKNKEVESRLGSAPEDKYYRRLDPENPYRRKYGEDWKKRIWTISPFHNSYFFVKCLVHHILQETDKIFVTT